MSSSDSDDENHFYDITVWENEGGAVLPVYYGELVPVDQPKSQADVHSPLMEDTEGPSLADVENETEKRVADETSIPSDNKSSVDANSVKRVSEGI